MFAQYPLLPQNQQHYINGFIGEERGGRQRYHYGLDMATPDGTDVYSIDQGIFNQVAGFCAIGNYAYVHVINPRINLASLKNDIFSIQNVNLRWSVLPEQLYNKIKEIVSFPPFFDSKSAQISRQQ